MDPNVAYQEYCEAREMKDDALACEAASALMAWLDRGGFYPKGLEYAREYNRFMAYVERMGLRDRETKG